MKMLKNRSKTEDVNNECFINGVCYKCRTCFDPARSVYSLKEECSKTKSWRELLKEVPQLQVILTRIKTVTRSLKNIFFIDK